MVNLLFVFLVHFSGFSVWLQGADSASFDGANVYFR